MKETKIILSPEEMQLVLNKDWLYLKRSVIDKAFAFLGQLHEAYNMIAKQKGAGLSFLPIDKMGKISRGENLEGLPYLMMDYPAVFSKEKIIAVRTLFWWGNFFSISLHLAGLDTDNQRVDSWLNFFKQLGFSINTTGNEWNYHFGDDGFEKFLHDNQFYYEAIEKYGVFRVSKKESLHDWEEAASGLAESFGNIVDFLAISFPGGETNLSPVFPTAGLRP